MGDAEWVASHTAVGAVVHRANVDNGNNRTIRAHFSIICRTDDDTLDLLRNQLFYLLITIVIQRQVSSALQSNPNDVIRVDFAWV